LSYHSEMRSFDAVEDRAEVLLQLFKITETVERKRDASEAAPELTSAYVRLLFAIGFARLGRPDRALVLLQALPADHIHDCLGGLLQARLVEALVDMAPTEGWPKRLDEHFEKLDRLSRYKTERVRDVLSLLQPARVVDGHYSFTEDMPWPAFGDPLAEARTALAGFETNIYAPQRFGIALGRLDAEGIRLMTDALDSLAHTPAAALRAWTSILIAAAREGLDDVTARAEERIGTLIPDVWDSDAFVRLLVFWRIMGRRPPAAQAIALHPKHTDNEPWGAPRSPPLAGPVLAEAACRALAGLAVDQDSFREAIVGLIHTPRSAKDLKAALRHAFLVYAHAPTNEDDRLVEFFMTWWPKVTDKMNTNTHLCLSVAEFVDSAVNALTTTTRSQSAALVYEDWLTERGHHNATLLQLLREGEDDLAKLQLALDPHRANVSRELFG
jgi:hypothetical protein